MDSPLRNLKSTRPDKRHLNSLAAVKARYRHTPPKLAYQTDMTREAFASWRRAVCEKLEELMTYPTDSNPGQAPRLLWREPREGYALEKWEVYPDAFTALPLLMLIPQGVSPSSLAPLVMCFSGSNHTKECLAGEPELPGVSYFNRHPSNNAMALHYVTKGLVAVAVDHPGIGELRDEVERDRRHDLSWNLAWMGYSYEAMSVSHKRCILQWLRERPFIDRQKIVMSGHSLGCKDALCLTLLEPGICALVYNDFACSWRLRQMVRDMASPGIWHLVPGLAQWFDYVDLMAAAAPTPMIVSEGGRGEWVDLIRDAYTLTDAVDRFAIVYYPDYATPQQRALEYVPIPEPVDARTFLTYANIQPDQHWFKPDVVLPWLERVLSEKI